MADQPFMFAITAGVFAAFTAVLFVARGKRYQSKSSTASEEQKSSSPI
jgi:hypothetical protein